MDNTEWKQNEYQKNLEKEKHETLLDDIESYVSTYRAVEETKLIHEEINALRMQVCLQKNIESRTHPAIGPVKGESYARTTRNKGKRRYDSEGSDAEQDGNKPANKGNQYGSHRPTPYQAAQQRRAFQKEMFRSAFSSNHNIGHHCSIACNVRSFKKGDKFLSSDGTRTLYAKGEIYLCPLSGKPHVCEPVRHCDRRCCPPTVTGAGWSNKPGDKVCAVTGKWLGVMLTSYTPDNYNGVVDIDVDNEQMEGEATEEAEGQDYQGCAAELQSDKGPDGGYMSSEEQELNAEDGVDVAEFATLCESLLSGAGASVQDDQDACMDFAEGEESCLDVTTEDLAMILATNGKEGGQADKVDSCMLVASVVQKLPFIDLSGCEVVMYGVFDSVLQAQEKMDADLERAPEYSSAVFTLRQPDGMKQWRRVGDRQCKKRAEDEVLGARGSACSALSHNPPNAAEASKQAPQNIHCQYKTLYERCMANMGCKANTADEIIRILIMRSPAMVVAIDEAKQIYQESLEKVLAATRRRFDQTGYLFIGHALTSFVAEMNKASKHLNTYEFTNGLPGIKEVILATWKVCASSPHVTAECDAAVAKRKSKKPINFMKHCVGVLYMLADGFSMVATVTAEDAGCHAESLASILPIVDSVELVPLVPRIKEFIVVQSSLGALGSGHNFSDSSGRRKSLDQKHIQAGMRTIKKCYQTHEERCRENLRAKTKDPRTSLAEAKAAIKEYFRSITHLGIKANVDGAVLQKLRPLSSTRTVV